ncbi:MAG TPA: Sec-independent protein translocase protein TatB [Acidimicrobiales bacterium]|nr:Sec-independent protein translocase protein TatB [Acidimicrobiales bacterium]
MFNVGTAELLVILLVALLVLGPNKLPDAARQVGRALGELRRLSSGFQAEMRDALREPVEGKPAAPTSTTPVKDDGEGALSSPKAPDAGADTSTTLASVTDGAGTTEDDDEHMPTPTPTPTPTPAPAPATQTEHGDEPLGSDGGTAAAPTGRGGTAASPPASDAGAHGSTPA